MTDPAELQRTWKRVVDNLVHEAPSKGSLLMSSSPVSDDGEKLVVSLPKGSRFAAKMLERADVRETVDGCVRVAFGYRQRRPRRRGFRAPPGRFRPGPGARSGRTQACGRPCPRGAPAGSRSGLRRPLGRRATLHRQ